MIAADKTMGKESFYVAVSRAKYDLKIYTEDKSDLLKLARKSKAKETALELIGSKPLARHSQVADERTDSVQPLIPREEVTKARTNQPARESSANSRSSKNVKLRQNISGDLVIALRTKLQSSAPKIALLTPKLRQEPEPPKQLEIFWTPTSSPAPPHIEESHWQELVEGSAIHPAIASFNFRSLQMGNIEQEHEAWEYLMYSDKLERTNIGQLTSGMLKRYAHIEHGGWWCDSGVNAISFPSLETAKPKEKRWGCYKPNEPRANVDKPGKKIKYEHPPKVDLGIFLLHVPDEIAQKIYLKAGIDTNSEDRMRGFWYCAWKYNLPVTITEGAKKAASLLSQGHVAIGLPGIYAGYRSKDEQGRPIKAHLHEELAVFATLGREITFCFDYETRPETKRNTDIAISRTGSLLQQQGAIISVISLPGSEKGVDDLIVAHNPLAYEQLAVAALPLKQWRERNKQKRHLVIVPPKKLSVQEKEEKLKHLLSGQHPINNQNLNQSPEEISHDIIDGRQIHQESTTDGRHNFVDGDRQLDSHRRGVESSEYGSATAKQGIEDIHPPAVERHSVDGEANAQRLYRPVQGSAGATEIGQTERYNFGANLNDEKSFGQVGGYEPSTDASQRTSDGSLRGDYQQETPDLDRQVEVIAPESKQQWQTDLVELAQLVELVNDERIIGDTGLAPQLASLSQQIKNLNPPTERYNFAGLSELAQVINSQQSQSEFTGALDQIQVALSELTQKVAANNELSQTIAANWTIAKSRKEASVLISALRPEIENLAQAVSNWHSEVEVEQALSQVSKVVRQIEPRHSFNFGEIPLLSEVNTKQLLQESGFANQVKALAKLVAEIDILKHQYKFEEVTEIAQLFSQQQTHATVVDALENIADLIPKLESRAASSKPSSALLLLISELSQYQKQLATEPTNFNINPLNERLESSSNSQALTRSPVGNSNKSTDGLLPERDEQQWAQVRRYLVKQRCLPKQLVDGLFAAGKLYADNSGNAVFLHTASQGRITGATVFDIKDKRFTYQFAPNNGTGYFQVSQGKGKLNRIVLTASPIEAMSLAALEQGRRENRTLYIDVNGRQDNPEFLDLLDSGVEIEVAFSAEGAGETRARQILNSFPEVTRRKPAQGKGWNEQLRSKSKSKNNPPVEPTKQPQQRFDPHQQILKAIQLDRARYKSACQADLKTAIDGLVAGRKNEQIRREIASSSSLVKHWEASGQPSTLATAKTIQYVEQLLLETQANPLYYQQLYHKYLRDVQRTHGHLPRAELDRLVASAALESHPEKSVRSMLKYSLAAIVGSDEYVEHTLAVVRQQAQDAPSPPPKTRPSQNTPDFEYGD